MCDNKKPLAEWTPEDVKAECALHPERCGAPYRCPLFVEPGRCRKPYEAPESCSAHSEPDPSTTTNLPDPPTAGQSDTSATMDKPRLCQVLGVEVGERFRLRSADGDTLPLHISLSGRVRIADDTDSEVGPGLIWALFDAINHPEAIVRLPQWDDDELALMRYLRKLEVAYITRDRDGVLCMWGDQPRSDQPKYLDECTWYGGDATRILEWEYPPKELMPHLRPGECVSLEKVVGDGT